MKTIEPRATLAAGLAVLLLLCAYPGQGRAGSRTVEPYNPKDDPNYTRATSKGSPVPWEAVSTLVREFEARSNAEGRRGAAQSAPAQPLQYTQAGAPEVPSQSSPEIPIYGNRCAVPYHVCSPSFPWWEASPRIPWWSLIPLTKRRAR